MFFKKFILVFLVLLSIQTFSSTLGDQKSIAVTIYNNDFAMVKDVRKFNFEKGDSFLYFTDVAQNIEAQTVTFKPIGNLGLIRVYEQNFQKNLLETDKILKKYIDKNIQLFVTLGSHSRRVSGKLLGYDNGYILQTNFGINIFNKVDSIQFPVLPDGFFTTPTLNWKVFSQNKQSVDCQVAYRTKGFSWKADYSLILNQKQTKADISGWVTIDNQSGKKYQNAKLKLIAGQVNIVNDWNEGIDQEKQYEDVLCIDFQFQQKSFSDFHLYTLSQPVTLNESSQKQVQFIPKVYNVSVRKYNFIQVNTGRYSQYRKTNLKTINKIQFANIKKNGLGVPFPKGTVRVFKEDSQDGSLQFIGQDNIDHTPKDQNITLITGKSFDIVVDLKTESSLKHEGQSYTAERILTIRNHKDIEAQVQVQLYAPGANNLIITQQTPDIQLIKLHQRRYKLVKILKPDQIFVFKWKQDYYE